MGTPVAEWEATSQVMGFMVATMNPFMMERRGFLTEGSARADFTPQFFACEQTKRINDRRTTTNARYKPTEAPRSQPRFPGRRDI
jgi:hypothetical protein